ncbi:DUF3396 domain-containing protein [Archangium violaceum]|nr:DUF3396 domain-containing protein [Archangium violaceum]
MHRPHAELSRAVMNALTAYLRTVGPDALGLYADEEGDWQKLDHAGWEHIREKMNKRRWPIIHLRDASNAEDRYRFRYYGRPLDNPSRADRLGMTCAASFWLPTEYLEEHGPEKLRELAFEVAGHLPFCSGYVGLSFNCDTELLGVEREIRQQCFRYPGMDIPKPGDYSLHLGTQVRGSAWMTFLGQPVLGELGGTSGLRSRLHSPGTTVQDMQGDRAVVTLGPWPEAGDTEQGQTLPAYRELARVLEPWLYHEQSQGGTDFTPEDLRRWERRFLD